MYWFRRLATTTVAVVISLMVVVFVLENQEKVQVIFLGVSFPEWPLAIYISLTFIIGGLIGLVAQLPLLTRLHMRAGSLRAELARSRKELEALRVFSKAT